MDLINNKKALFIIGSPFQGLCAIEAFHHYHINNYQIIIMAVGDSRNMLCRLLELEGLHYEIINISNLSGDLLKISKLYGNDYDIVFNGNYYKESYYGIGVLALKRKGRMIYLDDGIQALEIFSSKSRKRSSNWKFKIYFILFKFIAFLKHLKTKSFFTIYNVQSTHFKIEKNTLSFLIKERKNSKLKGVYIIGTNSTILKFKDYSYYEYLEQLDRYVKNRYGDEEIYYCPHRRDTNNEIIFDKCLELGFNIYNTNISVEYDFIHYNINPRVIIGFTSNALFTLKSIFPESLVLTVNYKLQQEDRNLITNNIRLKLNKYGIHTILLT